MPPLSPPARPRTLTLPARTAPAETDVLVVGGGPAGLGAALGAGAAGAEVVLAERHGFLGGNATAALVMPLMSFHTQRGRPAPLEPTDVAPWDHGPGDPVVVMPVAMATGQAAGVCAALAARHGKAAREVPAAEVQAELARQGASLR
jgi:hypothetical protein